MVTKATLSFSLTLPPRRERHLPGQQPRICTRALHHPLERRHSPRGLVQVGSTAQTRFRTLCFQRKSGPRGVHEINGGQRRGRKSGGRAPTRVAVQYRSQSGHRKFPGHAQGLMYNFLTSIKHPGAKKKKGDVCFFRKFRGFVVGVFFQNQFLDPDCNFQSVFCVVCQKQSSGV